MSNQVQLPLLDRVQIASPCSADWDSMSGDDRKRFCEQCSLHVYNIAEMTRDEAEDFLRTEFANSERTCARIFRREDGTILTKDCPVGIRRIRRKAIRAVAACVAFMFSGIAMAAAGTKLGRWAEDKNQALLIPPPPIPTGAAGGLCMAPPPGPTNIVTTPNSPPVGMLGDVAIAEEFRGQITCSMPERTSKQRHYLDLQW